MHQLGRIAAAVFCGVVPALASAQKAPDGWRWQLDRPAAYSTEEQMTPATWRLDEMVPGMHVTTGPGVVLLAPGEGAGRFMVDAELLLFPNSTDQGYGVVVGARGAGASPNSAAFEWLAFLVSGDGKFAVIRRASDKTTPLVDWRTHEAVVLKTKDVITNRLRVAVERDSVRFVANGKQVAALPRAGLQPDGAFGLRVEEGVNLHVTNVDIVRRLLRR